MRCRNLNSPAGSGSKLGRSVQLLTGISLCLAVMLLGQLYAALTGLTLPFIGQALLGLTALLPLAGATVAAICGYQKVMELRLRFTHD